MLTPLVQYSLDGNDITGKLEGRVLSGRIVEHDSDHADELHLVISNYDGHLAKPKRGAVITVSIGFAETSATKVGQFKIQSVAKIGGPAVFEITGQSADLKAKLKEQKTRSWITKPLSAALNQIAGDNGLSPAIDAEIGAVVGNWYQAGESDIHFVTRMARKFGAVGKVAEDRLIFLKRGTGETASGGAMGGLVVTPNDLEGDFRIVDQDRPNRKSVKAKVYDRRTATRTEVTKTGEGDGPDYVFPQIFASTDEAQKAVEGRKREFDRAGKSFSGTLKTGDTSLKAGGIMTTEEFGDDDDTDWTAERVTHDFGGAGYVVSFECKLKVGGPAPAKGGGGQKSGAKTPTIKEAGAVPPSNVG